MSARRTPAGSERRNGSARRERRRGTERARPARRRPLALQFGFATLVAVIALAVTLQAQRVSGQDRLEELHVGAEEASRQSAELRASVAAAESPAEVLEAAAADGMVQPAAVVAIPAVAPEDDPDGGAGDQPAPSTDASTPLG